MRWKRKTFDTYYAISGLGMDKNDLTINEKSKLKLLTLKCIKNQIKFSNYGFVKNTTGTVQIYGYPPGADIIIFNQFDEILEKYFKQDDCTPKVRTIIQNHITYLNEFEDLDKAGGNGHQRNIATDIEALDQLISQLT